MICIPPRSLHAHPLNETHPDAVKGAYINKRFHLVRQQGKLVGATRPGDFNKSNLLSLDKYNCT